jgi:hypothetical protein
MTYVMNGHGVDYVYYGTPFLHVLRGHWQRRNVHELTESISIAAESGQFDYALEHANRIWCREYHRYFPSLFQRMVHTVLFSGSTAGCRLPSDLWCHVFPFVHPVWFE